MHGVGRGGGIDKQWPLPNTRAIENMPTCWGFGLVMATLYTLLDVLVRFDATCRLEMILGSFLGDCEEVRLGERSGSCKGNTLFCHGGGQGKVDTGVDVLTIHQTAWRTKGWRTGKTSAARCHFRLLWSNLWRYLIQNSYAVCLDSDPTMVPCPLQWQTCCFRDRYTKTTGCTCVGMVVYKLT